MKEVQGELNVALIVAVSIGVLAAFFFSYIWPLIHYNFQSTSQCDKASCDCSKEIRTANDGKCLCRVGDGKEFTCIYKG